MTDELKKIQSERTLAEFCWTCTPLVIEHVLLRYNEKICTYIDADIYFFANPLVLIQEILDNQCSVGLVEHRFERNYEYGRQVFSNGKYCIEFNTFLSNKNGLYVLDDWKKKCLEWCYYRYEDGKLGDQKYTDKWKLKYSGVHESQNLGAGVAPWNLHLYSNLKKKDNQIWMRYRRKNFFVVFYHFEGMKYLNDGNIYLNLWEPSSLGTRKKIRLIYKEYFQIINNIRKYLLEEHHIEFNHMIVDKNVFLGKKYSICYFFREYGVINGTKKWVGYRMNNFI